MMIIYLNKIRYSDDMVIFTNNITELQYLADRASETQDLIHNIKKMNTIKR
jgi:hypothetical protein